MRGVVAVQRFLVLAVVPVVEVGRDEHVAQRAEAHAHVGMVEHRLEPDDDDVGIDHFLGKAQHVDGGQHQRARDEQLQDVLARAGHPVHALDAVVHGVQAP